MNKSTKGALAAAAAAVLLLGGAGSLAYWTADESVPGGTLTAGAISLSAPDCGTGWLLEGEAFNPATGLIVPGDSLRKVCTLTLTATGEHIAGTLTLDDTAITGEPGLVGELVASADFTVDTVAASAFDGAGTYAIEATITVDFPYGTVSTPDPVTGASNASQNDVAILDDLNIVAVQTHV